MAGLQTEKILLHASATVGKEVHRWVVAVFANDQGARQHAMLLKAAHGLKNDEMILNLDPQSHKGADGKPLSPVKLSVSTVPYNPHTRVDSGLDAETPTPVQESAPAANTDKK